MKSNLYTMRDRLSGTYGSPFTSVNDASAKRDFNAFCKLPQNQYLSGDMELYKLGEFESDTGEIISYKPEYIMRGEIIE